jgi:hypothetical protein
VGYIFLIPNLSADIVAANEFEVEIVAFLPLLVLLFKGWDNS